MVLIRLPFILCLFCIALFTACGKESKHSTYTIGVDNSWYPLDVKGREKNISLFSTELLQKIATLEDLHLSLMPRNSDALLSGLEEGKYEGMLASMQPYGFLEKKYDFSELYLKTGPVIVLPAHSTLAFPENALTELSGREIGVVVNSSAILVLEKVPGILIRSFDSIPQALNAILSGTVDGAAIDYLNALGYTEDIYANQLKIATTPLNDEGVRLITLHKGAPELMNAFNEGIEKLQKDGVLMS